MDINKVTAIFDEFRLKEVVETLIRHGVKGFTLHPVRGRGYYFDSFNENHLISTNPYMKGQGIPDNPRVQW